MYGGMAFSSAGLGLCYAMAHQPEGGAAYSHGLANAMLLPTVMEFNRMVCRERFSQVGRALRTKIRRIVTLLMRVSELIAEVGIKRMGDVGADICALRRTWAQAALEDIGLRSNPRTASPGADCRPVRSGAINAGCDACRVLSGLWDCICRADKAFTPHPGCAGQCRMRCLPRLIRPPTGHIGRIRRSRRIRQWRGAIAGCDACRVLSGLRDCTCRADKAFTPHPPINNN